MDIEAPDWMPIRDFEGIYEVSSLGQIRRIAGGRGAKVGRILKPGANKRDEGYLFVFLYRGNVSTRRYVHQIVTDSFHGPSPVAHEVNHIDGNKKNCCASNLEWVTKKENAFHAVNVLKRGNRGKTGRKNHLSRKYIITSPSGDVTRIHGLNETCARLGLDTGSMTRVAQGDYRHHRGWLCAYDDDKAENASKVGREAAA